MRTILAMAGCSCSGKSTYAEKLSKSTGFPIVSTDGIRKELSGSEENQDCNRQVFQVLPNRITTALNDYNGVIVDATHYNNSNRKIVETVALKTNAELIWHCFYVPFDELVKRQSNRTRKVPLDVIRRQFDGFTTPNSGTVVWH